MPFVENGPAPRIVEGWFLWDQPLASVRPEWVDGYKHMNMGNYLVAYDLQTDRLWPHIGLGKPLRDRGLGTFAAEAWLDYQREMLEGMPIGGASRVISFDEKRLLCRHRMTHLTEGWTASEHEVLYLCVDLGLRKVSTWPPEIMAKFAEYATGETPKRLALKRK
ncbi:thioesterase family protein [Roseococcus sp. YIM B11640]|uniref:thioesterase family protein n=1 Tax=Roseococcus sp. YIM B11640 TaxID=3133973 RepID=UPI003C7AC945